MHERTRLEHRDGCAWITMDDGKVNALSSALIGEVRERLEEVKPKAQAVVLVGREGIFSAGFDLGAFKQGPTAGTAMVKAGAELSLQILEYERPVLTVCTGHAYPAGAFLMLAADVRFGRVGPYRIGLNETAIGLTVPLFAIELARHRLAPASVSAIQSAQMFEPEEAVRRGYLDRALGEDDLFEAARQEAQRLTTLDPSSFAATKARVNGPAIARVREAIDLELAAA